MRIRDDYGTDDSREEAPQTTISLREQEILVGENWFER
jgi:hypothetical protein